MTVEAEVAALGRAGFGVVPLPCYMVAGEADIERPCDWLQALLDAPCELSTMPASI